MDFSPRLEGTGVSFVRSWSAVGKNDSTKIEQWNIAGKINVVKEQLFGEVRYADLC